MSNVMTYKLLEACREPGCPVCRVEQESVERYLDNQFYENVNSPRWRDRLRTSLGFCHEHAWLAVEKRLGDALGFTIIYHDLVNSILRQLNDIGPVLNPRRSFLQQLSVEARAIIEKTIQIISPRKPCPVCEHRDEAIGMIVGVLLEEVGKPEMTNALQASDGLCLPHLRLAWKNVRDVSVFETLLTIHREKLERLRDELAVFIRKSDYQLIDKGFGSEGDAWLRAVALVIGKRKEK